jgi:phage protein D
MLISQLGIRLVLLVGKSVPLPASYDVTTALTRVEVNMESGQRDGFQITFALGKQKSGDFDLLQSGILDPFTRVIIAVMMGVVPEVLIDGVITHHQISPSNTPGESTLTVTGKDVSLMMDLEEKNQKFENQPDFLIVTQLIASYAQYGLIPVVTPTTDVPIMLMRIPRQQETDMAFIQRLAQRNGYVFYIEPVTIGVNKAYWGPEIRAGIPQSALSVDLGSASNVKSIHFTQDALAPVATTGTFLEPITKTSIPIPQLPSLKIPPLSLKPAQARRTTLMRDTSNEDAAQAATSVLAAVTGAPDAVRGDGELDSIRFGGVLRARQLVGVRGAGLNYDGFYYTRQVNHTLQRGEYTQRFSISREGTGTLTPVVLP